MAYSSVERKDAPSFSKSGFQNRPEPHHLRALVLDYLCHYSFADTARALIEEDAVLENVQGEGKFEIPSEKDIFKGETLQQMRLRREIRQCITSGNVEKAIEIISEHFSSTIRGPSDNTPSQSVGLGHSRIHYISQTSVNPAHISLNLNILSFIELSRTIPLEYPPNHNSTPRRYEFLDNPELKDKRNHEQIQHAQKLLVEFESLTDAVDKSIYREELNNVIAILAYPTPENSTISRYFSQERRDAVAEQVNSAILHQLKRPAVSYLELYTRYITAVWSFMHDMKVKVPASSQPLLNRLQNSTPTQDKVAESSSQEQSDDIIPPFSLREFLDSR